MKRYRSPLHWLASAVGLMLVIQAAAQTTVPTAAAEPPLFTTPFQTPLTPYTPLTLHKALQLGVANYETIQAKALHVAAAQAEYKSSRTLYLPEVALSAQQFYGTANALHGPQYGFGEGNISMGAPQAAQNWEAAFSSLYTANLNWNIYSFGARSSKVNVAKNRIEHSQAQLEQALFEHQIKIASAYFDLAAIEAIVKVQVANVERSKVLVSTVQALVGSGMRPGVELSTAEAELASAQIALLKAQDQQALLVKELVMRMGVEYQPFRTDGVLVDRFPVGTLLTTGSTTASLSSNHPALRTHDAAIEESRLQTQFYQADGLPKLNVVGSVAARGSGFKYNYAQDTKNLSSSYLDGVGIDRGNYLVGVNLSWSITSLFKNRSMSRAQKQRTEALAQERALTNRQLTESYRYATEKRMLTQQQYQAVLKQVDAATQSYQQYDNLYSNGLAVVDDLISAIYNLARAESEQAVIQVNLWHAYLMQVASSGAIEPLLQQQ